MFSFFMHKTVKGNLVHCGPRSYGKAQQEKCFFLTVPCSNQSLKRNLPPQPVIRQILNIMCREGGVEEKHIPDYPPRNADRHHTC